MQFTLNKNSTCNAKSETWFLFFCAILRGWFHSLGEKQHFSVFNYDLINNQCSPSYKNQSIDLYCKSVDWFLYDREHGSLMEFRGCSYGGELARLGRQKSVSCCWKKTVWSCIFTIKWRKAIMQNKCFYII